MKIELSSRRAYERPTCVFCRDEVGPVDALALCPGCGVTFHEACRVELSRCPSPGCLGLDPEAFAARQRAEEEAERAAQIAAARARREAEDRGAALRGEAERERLEARREGALEEERARRVAEARARVRRPGRARPAAGEQAPASDPEVRRATTAGELGLCALGGAALGALAGGCVAHFTSRHGVELAHLLRWVPALAALGALEGAAVGAIGVRREPIVRWGKDRDATCLVAVLVAACMSATTALGVLVDAPLLVGPVAGFLLGLPVALRAFGLR